MGCRNARPGPCLSARLSGPGPPLHPLADTSLSTWVTSSTPDRPSPSSSTVAAAEASKVRETWSARLSTIPASKAAPVRGSKLVIIGVPSGSRGGMQPKGQPRQAGVTSGPGRARRGSPWCQLRNHGRGQCRRSRPRRESRARDRYRPAVRHCRSAIGGERVLDELLERAGSSPVVAKPATPSV